MSQAEPQHDGPDREINKTVQVVGYVVNNADIDPRHWANSYVDDIDFFSRDTRKITSRYLRGPNFEKRVSRKEYEKLSGLDHGDLELVRKVEEKEEWAYNPKKAAEWLKNEIMEEILDEDGPLPIYDVTDRALVRTERYTYDGETLCSLDCFCEEMPMLKEHVTGNVDVEDIYEDEDEELTVVKYKFSIGGVDQDTSDIITDQIIEPFVSALGRHEEVKTIRWLDCEVQTTEKGACFIV